MSAGSGPRASIPSARNLSIAGCHNGVVLSAEGAVLAGVRIEPGDRQARVRDLKPRLQVARNNASRLDNEIKRQLLRDLRERQVDGHRHDASWGAHSIITGRVSRPVACVASLPRNSV